MADFQDWARGTDDEPYQEYAGYDDIRTRPRWYFRWAVKHELLAASLWALAIVATAVVSVILT